MRVIRESGWVSTGPNTEKSCAGISGIPEPCAAAGAVAGAAGAEAPRTKESRSSLVIRPFGPLAVICARSMPNSRASLRTLGPACDGSSEAGPDDEAGAATRPAAAAGAEDPFGGPLGVGLLLGRLGVGDGAGVGRRRALAASSAGSPAESSSSDHGVPSLTGSPTETSTSVTRPACDDGTSIVALSDSRVSSGSSTAMTSPGDDVDLDDRDVGEVADVGDGDLGCGWGRHR